MIRKAIFIPDGKYMVNSSQAKHLHSEQSEDGNRVVKVTIIMPDGKFIVNLHNSQRRLQKRAQLLPVKTVISHDGKYAGFNGAVFSDEKLYLKFWL